MQFEETGKSNQDQAGYFERKTNNCGKAGISSFFSNKVQNAPNVGYSYGQELTLLDRDG